MNIDREMTIRKLMKEMGLKRFLKSVARAILAEETEKFSKGESVDMSKRIVSRFISSLADMI